jgi:hypothetical protein
MTRNAIGRPTTYTDTIAHAVLWELSQGSTLAVIARQPGMPARTTVYEWTQKHPEFADSLRRAREIAAHHYADQALEIADDKSNDLTPDGLPNHANVQRDRLRIDQRRWMAAKFNPATFGDKVLHTGSDGSSPIQEEHNYRFENLDREELIQLRRLLAKARGVVIEG